MIKNTILVITVFFFLFSQKGKSQTNFIQGFVIGLPFQSGAGIGNVGFEHHNIIKKK